MKKYFLWIIRLCTIAILFLPLYVDGSTIYPYTFSKMIAFQFLVEISLCAYIILQFLDRSYQVDWKNKLIQAQSIWIGVLIVLSFISVDVTRSWWSTAQWMTGTITYVHFYAWFIILASVFKEWKEWRSMIWASVGVSGAVALFGLGQLIGFGAAHYDPEQGRIYSTVGNPIYLAQYLLLHIFLAGFLLIKEKSQFLKILLAFFSFLFVGTIFFTGTRSAVLAFFVSIVLFLILLLLSTKSRRTRIASLSSCVAVIVCAVGLFLWLQTASGTAWAHEHVSPGMQRLIFNVFQDPARVELAHIAWQGFMAKPFFGWGPNNYSYVFSTFVAPHDFGILFPKLWYDQAHNHCLNILATTGSIGFVAYLFPWCVAWWLLWRKLSTTHTTGTRVGYSIIGLSLFAYFLQNLTVFDTPVPLISLYCIFAFIVFLTRRGDEEMKESAGNTDAELPSPLILGLVGVLTLGATIQLCISPYQRGQTGKKAIDIVMNDFDRGLLYFKRAVSGRSFVADDIRDNIAKAAFFYDAKYNLPKEKKEEYLEFAIAQMEEGLHRHPYSLEHGTLLLTLYRSYAKYSPVALTTAEELAQKLADRYPRRRDVLFEYMFIERDLGKLDRAKEYAQKIIDLDPTRGDAYWWMAQVLATAGDPSDSLDEIEKARKLGYPIFKNTKIFIQLALRPSADNYKRLYSLIDEAWFGMQLRTLDMAEAVVIAQTKLGEDESAMKILTWIRDRNPEYAKRVENDLQAIKK